MKRREAFEPAELKVVATHDARVGGDALCEINGAVARDRGTVGVMISPARKVLHQTCDLAIGADPQDPSALHGAAFGDDKRAIGPCDARPRAVVATACDLARRAVCIDAQQTGHGENLTVRIARFGHVSRAGLIECDARRECQPRGDDFDAIAAGHRDVGGADGARAAEAGFATARRGPHHIAALYGKNYNEQSTAGCGPQSIHGIARSAWESGTCSAIHIPRDEGRCLDSRGASISC